MPPDPVSDPNNPVLSRDLYEQVMHYATIPVLLFLILLSWFLINRLMSPWMGLVPRCVRPIKASAVASALLAATLAATPGVRILSSGDMQR